MTGTEWTEVVAWINDRFTRGWTADQAVAYGTDLKSYTAEDVWDAVYRLYDRGLEFPPNGSQLRAEVAEVVRRRIEQARWDQQGLPAPSEADDMSWEHWRNELGFAGLTFAEAARKRHAQMFPKGCVYRGCDVCGNVVDIETSLV